VAHTTYAEAGPLRRTLRRLGSSGPGSRLFAVVLYRVDKPVYRLSGGRFTLTSLLAGLPMAMLTTTGARSGKPRTVPVLGLPTPDGLAVISSNYGQRDHPAWYYNLRANPEGKVSVGRDMRPFRAVEAEGQRRERIWSYALEVYPGFSTYEKRAAHRRIAVWLLEAPG
jgi:deazaflavin-dependent oxidoreductase (nitroreductase family)